MNRASWKVNRSYGAHGPFVIQLAVSDGRGGYSFRTPRQEHRNFLTRKDAEDVKRTLPSPFIRHGIIVDGLTISAIAECGRKRIS
jgi:hypothetical protein